jgi:hypothetical protein
MYTEIVSIHDTARLRELVDPSSIYFSNNDLSKIIANCSGMLDRAVVKCLLGVEQKAKEGRNGKEVLRARTLLNRFEAGLIEV